MADKTDRLAGAHLGPLSPLRGAAYAPEPGDPTEDQRHIEYRFRELAAPVLETRLCDREAFRAIFPFGESVAGLADKGISNLSAAIRNANDFGAEIVEKLRGQKREAA